MRGLIAGIVLVLCCMLGLARSVFGQAMSAQDGPVQFVDVSQWRKIDTVLVLPGEYAQLPNGQRSEKTQETLIAEARGVIAIANEYLKPLNLHLNVVAVKAFEPGADDPYFAAYQARDSNQMIRTAVDQQSSLAEIDHDLVIVLGRGYFNGKFGLSYPSTSCVSPRFGAVFATQGGTTGFHEFTVAQTAAHEVGHFLGMWHDDADYSAGPSLMRSQFVRNPNGYSASSLSQALARVAPGLEGGNCFEPLERNPYSLSGDEDADNVSDLQEFSDGTNLHNADSSRTAQNGPKYGLWNGFLEMIDIAELVNPSDQTVQATLSLTDSFGQTINSMFLELAAKSQLDVILNELPGFHQDSLGLVRLDFSGKLEGRVSYYRLGTEPGSFEFVSSVPLSDPMYGKKAITFNTYQPSKNYLDQDNAIYHWLSIVNLSSEPETFRVTSFDMEAMVLRSKTITVPSRVRVDLDGGHGFAGSWAIGTHEIIPLDPAAPYLTQQTRYSSNAPLGQLPTHYQFALTSPGRSGSGDPMTMPVSAETDSHDWVEVSNVLYDKVDSTVRLTSDQGALLEEFNLGLPPHVQYHIDAASLLRKHGVTQGILSVIPGREGAIIAQSAFYYFDTKTGSISAMHTIPGVPALHGALHGSYNLFLGAENWVRVVNAGTSSASVRLRVVNGSSQSDMKLSVPASGLVLVPIHQAGLTSATADTYGMVDVEGMDNVALTADILRKRYLKSDLDFTLPTFVR